MKNLTKLAIGMAAAGGLCYVMRDKIKATKAYQTVESNETVRKAKTTAGNTYHKVKASEPVKKFTENENVKKAKSAAENTYNKVMDSDTVQKVKSTASDTWDKVKDSDAVQKAKATASDTWDKVKDSDAVQKVKDTATDTWDKVKDSDTVQKAKDTVTDKYDKLKDAIKDKMDSSSSEEREYFTLDGEAAETSAASDNVQAYEEASDVIGDEYMGLSDVSEDPTVLAEQDKLD